MMGKTHSFSLIKLLLSILLFSFALQQQPQQQQQQQCIPGGNCPYEQGACMGNYCKCLDGFYTLLNESQLPEQQMYCSYEQINVYYPLILEMCLPSIGHFYVGNIFLGILKLFLFASFLITSYLKFGYFGVPPFVIKIMEKLGISLKNFCPEGLFGDSEEKKDEEDGDKEKGIEEALFKSTHGGLVAFDSGLLLRNQQSDKDNNEEFGERGKSTQAEQAHNDEGIDKDVYKKEYEKPLVDYEEGNEKKEEEKEENKTLTTLFNISCIFWVIYFVDLYCYKFKDYTDGNDVPFVE